MDGHHALCHIPDERKKWIGNVPMHVTKPLFKDIVLDKFGVEVKVLKDGCIDGRRKWMVCLFDSERSALDFQHLYDRLECIHHVPELKVNGHRLQVEYVKTRPEEAFSGNGHGFQPRIVPARRRPKAVSPPLRGNAVVPPPRGFMVVPPPPPPPPKLAAKGVWDEQPAPANGVPVPIAPELFHLYCRQAVNEPNNQGAP